MWEVNFLVTGFDVVKNQQVGNVIFKPHVNTKGKVKTLLESCIYSKFPFSPISFSRATILVDDDNRLHACMKGLTEIERTLDTFAFTSFSQSKCLTIGYVKNPKTYQIYPIKYSKQHIVMPIFSIIGNLKMPFAMSFQESMYTENFLHLLSKQPLEFTESQRKVAFALRWFRLSALSRIFSDSHTVPFAMDWIALEMLTKIGEQERVKERLGRLPKILKHFPLTVINDYHIKSITDLPIDNEKQWETNVNKIYKARNILFHEGKIIFAEDFSKVYGEQEEIGDIGVLEAIAGRILAFVAKNSVNKASIKEIWASSELYQPTESDNPPRNLGGWIRGWIP